MSIGSGFSISVHNYTIGYRGNKDERQNPVNGTIFGIISAISDAVSSTTLAASEKPVADFYSPEINNQSHTGDRIAPSTVISFIDNSTGSPTSWL